MGRAELITISNASSNAIAVHLPVLLVVRHRIDVAQSTRRVQLNGPDPATMEYFDGLSLPAAQRLAPRRQDALSIDGEERFVLGISRDGNGTLAPYRGPQEPTDEIDVDIRDIACGHENRLVGGMLQGGDDPHQRTPVRNLIRHHGQPEERIFLRIVGANDDLREVRPQLLADVLDHGLSVYGEHALIGADSFAVTPGEDHRGRGPPQRPPPTDHADIVKGEVESLTVELYDPVGVLLHVSRRLLELTGTVSREHQEEVRGGGEAQRVGFAHAQRSRPDPLQQRFETLIEMRLEGAQPVDFLRGGGKKS